MLNRSFKRYFSHKSAKEAQKKSDLLLYNYYPSPEMLRAASAVTQRGHTDFIFKINYTTNVKIKASATALIKTIQTTDDHIAPDCVEFVRRNNRVEILNVTWFSNNENYLTSKHMFVIYWAIINNIAPEAIMFNQCSPKIRTFVFDFFKQEEHKIEHPEEHTLETANDWKSLFKLLEQNTPKAFWNNSNSIESAISFTDNSEKPEHMIVMKDSLIINDELHIKQINVEYLKNSYRIRRLIMHYKDIVQFYVNYKGEVLVNSKKNAPEHKEKHDSFYGTMITFKKDYPIEIESIKFPELFTEFGIEHHYKYEDGKLLAQSDNKDMPQNERILQHSEQTYHSVFYFYKKQKQIYHNDMLPIIENLHFENIQDLDSILAFNFSEYENTHKMCGAILFFKNNLKKSIQELNKNNINLQTFIRILQQELDKFGGEGWT